MKKGKQQQRKKQFVSFALAILLVMGLLQTGTTGESSFLKKFFQLDVLTMADDPGTASGSTSATTPTPSVPVTVYYSVHYVIDGSEAMGGENGGNTTTCESGSTMSLREPEKAGSVFDGWYLTSDYNPTNKVTSITVNSDMTVYGRWGFPIQYYADGEAVSEETYPKQYFPGEEIETLPEGPARDGLLFESWYQDETLATPVSGSAIGATDQTAKNFYAKYTVSEKTADRTEAKVYTVYKTTKLDLKWELGSYWKKGDTYTFTSLDEKKAKVDKYGVVTPVTEGETEIRVMRNGKYSFDVKICVKPVQGKLKRHKMKIAYNKNKIWRLWATEVAPSKAKITFKSSDEKVVGIRTASNENCDIKTRGVGKATVFLFVNGKCVDKCKITVEKGDPKLRLKKAGKEIVRRELSRHSVSFRIPATCQVGVSYKLKNAKYKDKIRIFRNKITVTKRTPRGKYIVVATTCSSKNYIQKSAKFVIRIK